MIWYMVGMVLLFGGFMFRTPSREHYLGAQGGSIGLVFLIFLISFIHGFFVYSWWVPLLSVFLSVIFMGLINTLAVKFQLPLFGGVKARRCEMVGMIFLLISIFK